MFSNIKQILNNPNDVPDVPLSVVEYLQVRYNYAYLEQTGHIELMRRSGCSESHILGFIQGLQYASNVIDEIETRKEILMEE